MLTRVLLLASLTTFGMSACDKADDDGADDHAEATGNDEHGTETDGAHESDESGETGEAGTCATETRDDDFAIGLSKSGSLVNASFVSADPAPPIKGDNTWVLMLEDMQGQPIVDASIVAIPMMPDHGHGTPVSAVVSALETPGHYEITPVNLFMTGYWQITFDVTLLGGEQDVLMYGFCVE